MFFFDFSNYFKMVRLAWNEKVPKARHYYLAVLLVAVPIVSTFHAICFLLDRIFYPDLRKVKVVAPIFMVGHARSGTTLTHRLLSQDEGRFSFFLLYELYFPSLLQKKAIRWLARHDAEHWRGFLAGQIRAWEEWRYGPSRHMHEMGLTQPEEDDIVLYWSMAAGFWITKMPYMGDLDFYYMNDWSARKRRRYNDFYRECIRRQLYLNGPEKIHLSKNPMYSGRVASLHEAFPDARFVVNVRDPERDDPEPAEARARRLEAARLGSGAPEPLSPDPRGPVVAYLQASPRVPRRESRGEGRHRRLPRPDRRPRGDDREALPGSRSADVRRVS